MVLLSVLASLPVSAAAFETPPPIQRVVGLESDGTRHVETELAIHVWLGLQGSHVTIGNPKALNITLYAFDNLSEVQVDVVPPEGMTVDIRREGVGYVEIGEEVQLTRAVSVMELPRDRELLVHVGGRMNGRPFHQTEGLELVGETEDSLHFRAWLAPEVRKAILHGDEAETDAVRPPLASPRTQPIMLLLGYSPYVPTEPGTAQPGGNVGNSWSTVVAALKRYGWPTSSSAYAAWGFYECDSGTTWFIDNYGLNVPNTHSSANEPRTQAQNHEALSNCGGSALPTPHLHARETNLQHLSYHWAWGVHEFTKHGACVKAVGYSMGGLIIRHALWRVEAEDGLPSTSRKYPPRSEFCVEDVVTLGTPHGGWDGNEFFCFLAASHQCEQSTLADEDTLLEDLAEHAKNPQGRGGTDWTLMGSLADGTALAPSATGGGMTPNHRVVFERVTHSDPQDNWLGPDLDDVTYSDVLTAPSTEWYDQFGTQVAQSAASGPWVGRWLDRSLAYDLWGCGTDASGPNAWPLSPGMNVTGQVYGPSTSDDCYYSHVVPAGQSRLVVDLFSPGGQQRNLRTYFGTVDCQQNTTSSKETCNIRNPPAGTYIIDVTDPSLSPAPFTVDVRRYAENDCGTGSDALDSFVAAGLFTTPLLCIGTFLEGAYDNEDWYAIDLTAAAALNVSLSQSGGANFEICLFNPDGLLEACGGSLDRIDHLESWDGGQSGRYRLRVSRASGYGMYGLSAELTGLTNAFIFEPRRHVPPGATFEVCINVEGYSGAQIQHAGLHWGSTESTTLHGFTWTNQETGDGSGMRTWGGCDEFTAGPDGSVLFFRAHVVGPHETFTTPAIRVDVASEWELRHDDSSRDGNVFITSGADVARKWFYIDNYDLDWSLDAHTFRILARAENCWPLGPTLDFNAGRAVLTSRQVRYSSTESICGLWSEADYSWANITVPLSALTGEEENFFQIAHRYNDIGSDYLRTAMDLTPIAQDRSDVTIDAVNVDGEWMGRLVLRYPVILSSDAPIGRVEGLDSASRPPEGGSTADMQVR